jgi:hypothetical protein
MLTAENMIARALEQNPDSFSFTVFTRLSNGQIEIEVKQLLEKWVVPEDTKPIGILQEAMCWLEACILMYKAPNESIEKQIKYAWMLLLQSLHWVYKNKFDAEHKIPEWRRLSPEGRKGIDAYGNYLLSLLNLVILVGLYRENSGEDFNSISYFADLCKELLKQSYEEAISNIKNKTELVDKHFKILAKLRGIDTANPYSNGYLREFHSEAKRRYEAPKATPEYKKCWKMYLHAYSNLVKDMDTNSVWTCGFDNGDGIKVAYHRKKAILYV